MGVTDRMVKDLELPREQVFPNGDTKGLSVHGIRDYLLERCKSKKCPRDKKLGAAYVDCVKDEDAGLANMMISYTWQYEVRVIIDSLCEHCKRNGLKEQETVVWICFACNSM